MIPDYRVLHKKRIPVKLPIIETFIAILLVEIYELDSWGLGSLIAFMVLLWVTRIGMKINQYMIDPFNN